MRLAQLEAARALGVDIFEAFDCLPLMELRAPVLPTEADVSEVEMRHDYVADMTELDREKAHSARAIELLALQVRPFCTHSEGREIEKDREVLDGFILGGVDVPEQQERAIRQRWNLEGK